MMRKSAGIDAKPGVRARWIAVEAGIYRRLRLWADQRQQRRARTQGSSLKPGHLRLGEQGEDAAYFFLRQLGYAVVARRWRSPRLRGDLDLVAWQGRTLVVAEVKTRSARDAFAAEEAVDRDKRNQLRLQAEAYLRHLPEPFRQAVELRFDVVSVYLVNGESPVCEHFQAAFARTPPPEDRPRRAWQRW
ncbi:MAG: YraN family protein [Acidobacteriaceae bacterium]|nr:YraN family protein [Acidobacteriaceae bacterium]